MQLEKDIEEEAEVEEWEGKFDIVESAWNGQNRMGKICGGQWMGAWNGRFEVVRHGKGLKRRNGEKG